MTFRNLVQHSTSEDLIRFYDALAERCKIHIPVLSYSAAIIGFGKKGDAKSAMRVFEELDKKSIHFLFSFSELLSPWSAAAILNVIQRTEDIDTSIVWLKYNKWSSYRLEILHKNWRKRMWCQTNTFCILVCKYSEIEEKS